MKKIVLYPIVFFLFQIISSGVLSQNITIHKTQFDSFSKNADSIIIKFEGEFHGDYKIYIDSILIFDGDLQTDPSTGSVLRNKIIYHFHSEKESKLIIINEQRTITGECYLKAGPKYLYLTVYHSKFGFEFSNVKHIYY